MIEFIKNISPVEWLVILLLIVILFGRSILIKLGRTGGETVKEMKNVKKTFTDTVEGEEDKPKKEVG